jgi:STE24 endopeptidase
MTSVAAVVLALILGKWAAQLWLARLNERHVRRHADAVPELLRGTVDPATYTRSVEYTLAKSRLHRWEMTWSVAVLLALLFSGALPQACRLFINSFGNSVWSMAAFLFAVGVALSIAGLPFDWSAQFRLEQRFGFNTTTPRLWWMDRLKGLLLTMALGYPLLALVLKLAAQAGAGWWIWAWALVLSFELLMVVLAPVVIMPLFNQLTPLPEGHLRERLLRLADQSAFRARSIQVMDGSKRSRHSNAFFTGFGRFRKIVLFDTLIEQLQETELAAVLAHEIGHYQKGHIPKMLAGSAASLLAAFAALAWLAEQDWFYRAFGFAPGPLAPALLLFALLSGTLTFWFTPLANFWSRRFEYQADAFAAQAMGETGSLIGALRKLNEKNLSNLTPHPLYSRFYYSHPALLERERALVGKRDA